MSTNVRWPAGMARITPSQCPMLPVASSYVAGGSFVVGEGSNIVQYVQSPEYQEHLAYESGIRVLAIRHAGGRRVSDLLNVSPTVTLSGRGRNESFFRYVERMQGEKRLIDVTGITNTPEGVSGQKMFPHSTLNTSKYASTELPFVSKDKNRYFNALDYYAGEGSYPHVRAEITAQDKRTRPTKDIGKNWFKNGPYQPEQKVVSHGRAKLLARTPDIIFQSYNTGTITLAEAVVEMKRYYEMNPLRLPDDKLAYLRQSNGPYTYASVEEIQRKWFTYLAHSILYLFPYQDANGVQKNAVTMDDLFQHFSVTPMQL